MNLKGFIAFVRFLSLILIGTNISFALMFFLLNKYLEYFFSLGCIALLLAGYVYMGQIKEAIEKIEAQAEKDNGPFLF